MTFNIFHVRNIKSRVTMGNRAALLIKGEYFSNIVCS